MCETADQSKNYSILLPRKTSAVGFFTQTKIKDNFYLTKQEILNGEEELQRNKNHKNKNMVKKGKKLSDNYWRIKIQLVHK